MLVSFVYERATLRCLVDLRRKIKGEKGGEIAKRSPSAN